MFIKIQCSGDEENIIQLDYKYKYIYEDDDDDGRQTEVDRSTRSHLVLESGAKSIRWSILTSQNFIIFVFKYKYRYS